MIEAAYRVTPTGVERVVERTGAKYVADMRALCEQVGQLYEAQLATQAERDDLRARLDVAAAAPVAPEAPTVLIVEADSHPPPTTLWWRLLRRLRDG